MKYDLYCLNGVRYNYYTVVNAHRIKSKIYCKCKCECGKIKDNIYLGHLKNGHTKSCGCHRIKMISTAENLIGQVFDRLTVIDTAYTPSGKNKLWKCKCKCGNETIVSGINLRHGNSKSCGCLQKEIAQKTHRKKPYITIYKNLLKRAKVSNLPCDISYNDFLEYTFINKCYYCGNDLIWTKHNTKDKRYNGYNLDRKDNNKGYTKDNCVPCCKICNHIKGNIFSESEMLKLGNSISEILKSKIFTVL